MRAMSRSAVVLLLLLAGCAGSMVPLTPEGRKVKAYSGNLLSMVAGCTPLNQMVTTSAMTGLFTPQGQQNNLHELMNRTAEAGGNTLVITTTGDHWQFQPTAHGTAYRCPAPTEAK